MRFLAIFLGIILFLAGCSTIDKNESKIKESENIEPVEVNIVIHPSPVEVNNEIIFEAIVTQGKEKVEDASDVEFEIWKSGVENHKKMKGKHQGEGIYSIKETFTEVGTYNVIAHVTARDMHTMPKREFEVVDLSAHTQPHPQSPPVNDEHHHGSGVIIHLMSEEVKVNEKTELNAHISQNETPLTGGNVRFEVWKEGQKHYFIDATESGNGEYVATNIFLEQGVYNIKVHLKKNEIHDHKVETITVK